MIEELAGTLRRRFDFWQRWHPHVLHSKGMTTSESLWNGLLIDVASSLVAVDELSSRMVVDLIEDLGFPPQASHDILSRAADRRADHLGFRIYVPMDVYMEVLPLWIVGLGWELMGTKRFAPSARFQERVGGGTEMAQVWVSTPEGLFQIELFDIHTRLEGDSALLATSAAEVLQHPEVCPGVRSWEPFMTDEIWHYGILLATTDDVALIHGELTREVIHRADLGLRNDDVVVNLWHGSHHTKIAKVGEGLEIEFLSYVDDWGQG